MNTTRFLRPTHLLTLLPALALVAAGCDTLPAGPSDPAPAYDIHADHTGHQAHGAVATPSARTPRGQPENLLLAQVRGQTARFSSLAQAERAGYAEASHCVSHPELGAMGYHFVNFGLVDPVFDPMEPEALLYAPDGRGGFTLVGVEYIVIDIGQPRPHFGDHPFDIGGAPVPVPHWTLHVWAHAENPSGVFSPFNPNVSCG
jgi:hypothetical protein